MAMLQTSRYRYLDHARGVFDSFCRLAPMPRTPSVAEHGTAELKHGIVDTPRGIAPVAVAKEPCIRSIYTSHAAKGLDSHVTFGKRTRSFDPPGSLRERRGGPAWRGRCAHSLVHTRCWQQRVRIPVAGHGARR